MKYLYIFIGIVVQEFRMDLQIMIYVHMIWMCNIINVLKFLNHSLSISGFLWPPKMCEVWSCQDEILNILRSGPNEAPAWSLTLVATYIKIIVVKAL